MRRAGLLLEQADAVLLTKRWVLEESYASYLPVFITKLEALGKTVAIGGNTVEYAVDPPILLRRLAKQDALSAEVAAQRMAQAQRPEVTETNTRLRVIATAAGVPYLDKTSLLCSPDRSSCPALTPEGEAVYIDYGHLSLAGAKQMAVPSVTEIGWLLCLTCRVRNDTMIQENDFPCI